MISARLEIKHIPTGTEWIGNTVNFESISASGLNQLTAMVNSWGKQEWFALIGANKERISFGKTLIAECTCTLYAYEI